MKLKPLFVGWFAALVVLNAWAQDPSIGADGNPLPKADDIFHVGQVGQPRKAETREKLLAVFQDFQKHYALDKAGKVVPLIVPSGAQTFNGLMVLQLGPKDFVFANSNGGSNVKITTVDSHDWKVSDQKTMVILTAGTAIYDDPTGGRRQVLAYLEVPETEPPAREQFVAALKAGQAFTVNVVEKRDNPVSGGLDYVWAKDAAGAVTTTKIPVEPTVPTYVTYTVKW